MKTIILAQPLQNLMTKILPDIDPKKELVLGLNVGDIDIPRTGTILAYRSEIVRPMSPNVKQFFVKLHKKL